MRLLVTGALTRDESELAPLRDLGFEVVFVPVEADPLPASATLVDGVICNALFEHHDVSRFPNLRFVQLTSAGLERAPVDALAGERTRQRLRYGTPGTAPSMMYSCACSNA